MSTYERPPEPALQEALKKLALGQWLTAAERECVLMEVARLQSELGRERYLRQIVEEQHRDAEAKLQLSKPVCPGVMEQAAMFGPFIGAPRDLRRSK